MLIHRLSTLARWSPSEATVQRDGGCVWTVESGYQSAVSEAERFVIIGFAVFVAVGAGQGYDLPWWAQLLVAVATMVVLGGLWRAIMRSDREPSSGQGG
jgi:hypothetical protein